MTGSIPIRNWRRWRTMGGLQPTHALRAASPAIDTADSVVCPATDERGRVRPVDGNA